MKYYTSAWSQHAEVDKIVDLILQIRSTIKSPVLRFLLLLDRCWLHPPASFSQYSNCFALQSLVLLFVLSACLPVKLSKSLGSTLLLGSGCEMSPFNMIMSLVPVVPLGRKSDSPGQVCVCSSAEDTLANSYR